MSAPKLRCASTRRPAPSSVPSRSSAARRAARRAGRHATRLAAGLALLAGATAAQLVHDECSGALPLVAGVTTGSTAGATDSPVMGSCSSFFSKDVWFEYVASTDGLLIVSLVDGGGSADFDTVLAVWSGTCTALVPEACNDDSGSFQSKIVMPVVAGTTYYVELGGWGGDTGHFEMAVDELPPVALANDTCDNALPVGPGTVDGQTFFAATDPVGPTCAAGGAPVTNDLWYLYTATADGAARASLVTGGGQADFDTVLGVFVGGCDGLTEVACNDDAFGLLLASEVEWAVTAGSEYRIAVGGWAGSAGTFTLSLDEGTLPDNDDCDTAVPVGLGHVSGDSLFASDSPESGTCALGGLPVSSDVWYRFVAPGDGLLRVSTTEATGGGADFDTVIALFGGACGALTELACNDDAGSSLQSLLEAPVEAGQTYWIAVGGFLFSEGHFTLAIDMLAPPQLPVVVAEQAKIADFVVGFGGGLPGDAGSFGRAVVSPGDLDGDDTPDLVVGSPFEGGDAPDVGALWVLFLHRDGSVKDGKRLASDDGSLPFATGHTRFGSALAALGDLDGDGAPEIAVGAPLADAGGAARGTTWVLSLQPDGSVSAAREIGPGAGGFAGNVADGDAFGSSLARLDDLDGDGVPELAVGMPFGDNGGEDRGALWVLFLAPDATVTAWQRISDTNGSFTGPLQDTDMFGHALASLGDVDGDGLCDLAVGAPGDDAGGVDKGAVWLLHLKADGKVAGWSKVSGAPSSLGVLLPVASELGASLAALPDADGDGAPELLAGARGDGDGGAYRGALWLLRLLPGGALKGYAKISDTHGGFGGVLGDNAFFGQAAACLGDLDGDGRDDAAVGDPFDDEAGLDQGAVWLLFLDAANTWVDGGFALPGAAGPPFLMGHGALVAEAKVSLTLDFAAPSSATLIVMGESTAMMPLHGGLLVPAPERILFPYVTDGTGHLEVAGRWPPGVEPGRTWWFQAWIADPTAPQGFAASNAASVQSP